MCGIGGYFSRGGIGAEDAGAMLGRMASALRHRGPDDEGTLITPHAGLVATRLAIVDLAGGHMPLFNEDGTVAVAFNGEIYNHLELREALKAEHVFKTRADTEVLVHLYEERGLELMGALAGMFAFALFDAKAKRLLLARDRFGIKPLFVAETGDGILFASEAKAILATGRVPAKLDPLALRDVFSCGYAMPPRTMFAGIRQLQPGSWLALDLDKRAEGTYWSMPYPAGGPRRRATKADLGRAAGELRERFAGVVKAHLAADVPVASYLSGGLDSISVAAEASRQLTTGPLTTFSMGFSSKDIAYDESLYFDIAAREIGSAHHTFALEGISREDYEATVLAMESPQVHTVAFCLFQLARFVRSSGLKVVLSGEGADELFAGYGVFRLSRLRRWFGGHLRPLRGVATRVLLGLRGRGRSLARALDGWWAREKDVALRYGLVPPWIEQWWLLADASNRILSRAAREALAGAGELPLPDVHLDGMSDALAPLHHELLFEQRTRLDGWVLALGDRLTMAHSVEGRVPFLDHRLAEWLSAQPPEFLLRGMHEKHLLREAMRGLIPEALRRRKKRAFVAPISSWLFGKRRPEFVDEALSPRALEETELFDPAGVRAELERLASGARTFESIGASWALNAALGTQILARRLHAGL